MMKKLLLIAFIAAGCSPVYVPNARNSPLFTKAGEFQGTASLGNGLDVQTAASITNHIGVMANYSYENRTGSRYTNAYDADDYHYHQFFEGGVGYYENIKSWCYEIFAGYGKGEGRGYGSYNFWNNEEVLSTGKYDRFFLQPAIGLNKKIMHLALVSRVSFVNFTEFSDGVRTEKIHDSPRFYFEPGVVGRVNLADNHLMLMFQVGASVHPSDDVIFYDYRAIQFSTGIGFRIGGIKKERPTNASGQY